MEDVSQLLKLPKFQNAPLRLVQQLCKSVKINLARLERNTKTLD